MAAEYWTCCSLTCSTGSRPQRTSRCNRLRCLQNANGNTRWIWIKYNVDQWRYGDMVLGRNGMWCSPSGRCRELCGRDEDRKLGRLYAIDPDKMQDIIVGGAVLTAVSSALLFGFRGEKEVCTSCNGTGGVVCFACNGTGVMTGDIPVEIENKSRQQSIGRNKNKRECIACKGVGKLLCKSCGGSGYK